MKIAEFVSTSEGYRDKGPVIESVPEAPKVTGTINLNPAKVVMRPASVIFTDGAGR